MIKLIYFIKLFLNVYYYLMKKVKKKKEKVKCIKFNYCVIFVFDVIYCKVLRY